MSVSFELVRDPRGCDLSEGEAADITPLGATGGIVKHVIKKCDASGEYPNYGDKVTFEYTAYHGEDLEEENVFDSSEKDGKPFEYECLKGRVVRGFELAVLTMKPGERAFIYLKPEYAFGKEGSIPRVPPDTPVVFDTTILSVSSPDLSLEQDMSITKKTIIKGKGFEFPNQGAEVTVHIRGELGDNLFMDKDVVFPLGEGSAQKYDIPSCVEEHLDQWKLEERARLFVKAKHAYGNAGCDTFGIPSNADLTFIITMKNFKRVKDSWSMNSSEKLDLCKFYKEKGNTYYQTKEYKLAEKFYSKIIQMLLHDMSMEGEKEERRQHFVQISYQNLAQAELKLLRFVSARESCTEALKMDQNSKKAYFRRGMASFSMQDFSEAKKDFTKVLELEPDNEEAAKYLRLSEGKMKATESKMKVLEKKMILAVIGKN